MLAGLGSIVPEPVRTAMLLGVLGGLLVLDLTSRTLPLPQRRLLIPQRVFLRGLAAGLLRFGAEYGTGFRTLVPSAAAYMLAGYVVLAHPAWWISLSLGALFGLARSLAIAQFVLLGRDGWVQFLGAHTRLLERLGSVVCAALLAWVALAAVS